MSCRVSSDDAPLASSPVLPTEVISNLKDKPFLLETSFHQLASSLSWFHSLIPSYYPAYRATVPCYPSKHSIMPQKSW